MRRSNQSNRQQGDVSILFAFLMLTVFVLGAIVAAVLAVSSLRGARDIVASTRAFNGADTGIERALNAYNWDTNGEEFPADLQTCLDASQNDQLVGGRLANEMSYRAFVTGRDADGNVVCPPPDEVASGAAALCLSARGRARGGTVQRLVTNNFVNAEATEDPCATAGL